MTYAQAFAAIIKWLEERGWTLSDPTLKIRHITSKDGKLRFWFRPQSIYFTVDGDARAGKHSIPFGNARSIGQGNWDWRSRVLASVAETCGEMVRFIAGRDYLQYVVIVTSTAPPTGEKTNEDPPPPPAPTWPRYPPNSR